MTARRGCMVVKSRGLPFPVSMSTLSARPLCLAYTAPRSLTDGEEKSTFGAFRSRGKDQSSYPFNNLA
jgi:hypothetical protein